jgi:transcriptional regulator with XRE-family HTH domain
LRALRRRQGLTQVEMAAQLGISPSYLNLIEHNQRALTLALLLKLAEAYDVDMQAFSGTEEARLLADLTELFGDPVLREHEIGRQALSELVGTVPEVTRAIFSLYRAYRNAREDVLGLTERLADNPYLSVACHRLLTFLTSIRSCSEILQDNLDLPLERRRHFVDILVRESENLTELANELFDFFAGHGLRELRGAGAPADEVTDVLHARGNYFPGLEAAAQSMREEIGLGPANAVDTLAARLASAHGVTVEIERGDGAGSALRRYDAPARRLVLSEALPRSSMAFQLARQLGSLACAPALEALVAEAALASPAARSMYCAALENYFAGALLMPYDALLEGARSLRHDIELLQRRFG